ncbi:Flp pilus assembly protein CpaB, partial [Gluconobacter oxydans]|uniref:Flp pilus assembly protein CpaB n=1 Tax=Gluconobacter oxydans TaxID=442 RepID=UPI0039E753EE
SLLICFAVTPLFNAMAARKTRIVRMTQTVAAGQQITKAQVETVEVGAYNLPDSVLKSTDNVVGKYADAQLDPGDYILSSKVSASPAGSDSYLSDLNGTKQAVSVTLKTLADGVSGKLKPGDIVSVIAPDYQNQGSTVVPPELKYVEVIGVTTSTGTDAGAGASQTSSGTDSGKTLPSTVTLLATPEQSTVLAGLEADGKLQLSLVYRGSKANAQKFLDAQDQALKALYPNAPGATVTASADTSSSASSSGASSEGGK